MGEQAMLEAVGMPAAVQRAWRDMRLHLADFGVEGPDRTAHFLAQCSVESGRFQRLTESMNYSVDALSGFAIFRRRPDLAQKYGRIGHWKSPSQKANQEAIANTAYADANRDENHRLGNTEPGDGWRFIGRGWIHLTGRWNYLETESDTEFPITRWPEILLSHHNAAITAASYFRRKGIWEVIDRGGDLEDVAAHVTKLVQGGESHLDRRTARTRLALEAA